MAHASIDWPRPVALALAGGAALGALQVGMLRALAEVGCRPDLVVGTSIGAINGAFIAQHGLTLARVDELARIWRELRFGDVFTGMGLGSIARLATGGGTLCSDRGMRGLLARHLPRDHAELAIPFHAVALDLGVGGARVLSGGALHPQLMASAAIPMVFPRVMLQGRAHVDGGLVANCPLVQAESLGARTVVVLDAGFPCRLPGPPEGSLGQLLHAFQIAMRHHVHLGLRLVSPQTTVIFLPSPCPLALAHHDFSGAHALIDPAHEIAREFLAGLGAVSPGVHGHPHVHAHASLDAEAS